MTKIKKQIILIAVILIAAAAMGVAYWLLSLPEESDTEPETVETGPFGETMKNGRPYIVDTLENEDMNSIKVHNAEGEYSLIHKKSGAYQIEGLEDYDLNQQMLALLRVNTMNLLAIEQVKTAELDKLEQYGISKDDPSVWFEVVYNDEKDSYKILLGDKTPDSNGYYAMLEGRDALYILDTGVESCVLQPKSAYITPTIANSIESTQAYTLKNFSLSKGGELFVEIEKASGDYTYGNNSSHRLTYPAYNYATSLTYFEMLLTALSELGNEETAAYFTTLYYGDEITDELLSELGFFDSEGNDISDYFFKYSYPSFSEYIYAMKDEGGESYTVYSLKENIIVTVPQTYLSFLEWDMLLWISSEIYMLDIEDIASVVFEHEGSKAAFEISGTGSELTASCNGVPADTDSFKELYKSIMYVLATAYAEESEYGAEQLGLTITTEKGEVLEYIFYAHTAMNSYYTLNGFGEFYVSAEKVLELRAVAFGFIK